MFIKRVKLRDHILSHKFINKLVRYIIIYYFENDLIKQLLFLSVV